MLIKALHGLNVKNSSSGLHSILNLLKFRPLTPCKTLLQKSNREMTKALTNILNPSYERYFRMRPIDLIRDLTKLRRPMARRKSKKQ